jgi:hypothetical protein
MTQVINEAQAKLDELHQEEEAERAKFFNQFGRCDGRA